MLLALIACIGIAALCHKRLGGLQLDDLPDIVP
jgi:hypothetical protein